MIRPTTDKRRPLSQSLSINNLHRLTGRKKEETKGDRKRDSKIENKRESKDLRRESKDLREKRDSRQLRSVTSSTPSVTTTNSDITMVQRRNKSMLLDDDKRKSKRFSINFMKFNESDSEDDKSTIDNSPFTQNNDSHSLNLSSIDTDSEKSPDQPKFPQNVERSGISKELSEYDTTVDSKKRTSNLSNIMEFVNQINYDFDDSFASRKRELLEMESNELNKFNRYYDYNIKLVGNGLIFGYFDEQADSTPLGLDDMDHSVFTESPYEES